MPDLSVCEHGGLRRKCEICGLRDELTAARTEIGRLQRILDSRPAINAGLPETYIAWSRGVYEADFVAAKGADS